MKQPELPRSLDDSGVLHVVELLLPLHLKEWCVCMYVCVHVCARVCCVCMLCAACAVHACAVCTCCARMWCGHVLCGCGVVCACACACAVCAACVRYVRVCVHLCV
jgi:hypothetical protein